MTNIRDVLVTGVSGRASGTLAERMQSGGFRVRALVRTAGQAAEAELSGWAPVHGDLTRPESLTAALAGASVVVHGAAYIRDDWDRSLAVNLDGTRALAEASLAAGAERFINISTMSVYGVRDLVVVVRSEQIDVSAGKGAGCQVGGDGARPENWVTSQLAARSRAAGRGGSGRAATRQRPRRSATPGMRKSGGTLRRSDTERGQ